MLVKYFIVQIILIQTSFKKREKVVNEQFINTQVKTLSNKLTN